jgi:hypothetical protein
VAEAPAAEQLSNGFGDTTKSGRLRVPLNKSAARAIHENGQNKDFRRVRPEISFDGRELLIGSGISAVRTQQCTYADFLGNISATCL